MPDSRSRPVLHARAIRGAIAAILALLLWTLAAAVPAQERKKPSTLLNLSGLVWMEDDLFIGVHDAKRDEEEGSWPRLSLVRLPKSELEGVVAVPLALDFPGPGGPGSDLESAGRIPGSNAFLFAESGQDDPAPRIFLAEYGNGTVKLASHAPWPVPITNVEAIAVGRLGRQLVFVYAERADGMPSTTLRWAPLTLNPLSFGEFRETHFAGIDPVGPGARPIVALEIDSEGGLYVASAFDPGSDEGPFRSTVWRIGSLTSDSSGNPLVSLGEAKRLATFDGMKVESLALREPVGQAKQLFVGTDDEHYGGSLRLLPVTP